MKKNDELVGLVVATGSAGEGIIKQDGTVIFVPFALLGEKVKIKILKVTSKCSYGKLLEVLTPSESRVRAKCPVFTKCGGCQLQHVKYANQLKMKEEGIKTTFRKVAGLDVDVQSAIRGENEFRYRNKLQLPVSNSPNGTVIGFYAETSHRVVPIEDCLINASWTADIIKAFKAYIDEFNIQGYDELSNTGELREITVKEIKANLIITAVVLDKNLRGVSRLIDLIKENVKFEFSLYLNVNNKKTNVIFGEEFHLVYGKPNYMGDMLGIKYKIGVQSFMQVNDCVCSKLYATVKQLVNANENTTVIDAYSGAGLMTALLAKEAKKAIGVEIIKEAVECSNDLALINKLNDKITNYNGKCEDLLPTIIAGEKAENADVCVVLDPPRKGCDIKVINAILKSDIDKIVYVSCMPSTLARDVGLLMGSLEEVDGQIKKVENPEFRYKLTYVRPFDMFAQTKHVETVVCLEKVK